MKTKSEILNILRNNRSRLDDFGVHQIGLFGSVARGEEQQSSDVDILIDLEHHTFDSYMGLLLFLEDLLGSRVDLVMRDTLKPVIKDSVLSETVYVPNT